MVILLAAAILTTVLAVRGFSFPALPFDFEHPENYHVHYHAREIGKPWQYWVLTDPDPCILEAIECEWSRSRANETTFIYQVYERGAIWEIEHEGHYYSVHCIWTYDTTGLPILYEIHNPRHEKELAVGLAPVLSVAWIALGTLWIKKKPQ